MEYAQFKELMEEVSSMRGVLQKILAGTAYGERAFEVEHLHWTEEAISRNISVVWNAQGKVDSIEWAAFGQEGREALMGRDARMLAEGLWQRISPVAGCNPDPYFRPLLLERELRRKLDTAQ